MKRLTTWGVGPVLALTLMAASGTVSAQQVGALHVQPSTGGYSSQGGQYDYARVVRVDPVIDSGRYGSNDYASGDRRCYQRQDHARGSVYDGGYRDGYGRDDYYRGNDGYDRYGNGGSQIGGTMATVIGGVVGAVIGSQVGGGSARYATSAIGSMVGGVAGRQIYEQSQRQRDYAGTVTVCDPVPVGDDRYARAGNIRTAGRGVTEYDVTYEYAGREYTTRTQYHPGDRIRVRVDVRPE